METINLITRQELKTLLLLLQWEGLPPKNEQKKCESIWLKVKPLATKQGFTCSKNVARLWEVLRNWMRGEIENLVEIDQDAIHFKLLHSIYVANQDIDDIETDNNLALALGSIKDYLTRARYELLLVINAQIIQINKS